MCNRVVLVPLLAALPLILSCASIHEGSCKDALDALLHSGGIELVEELPLRFQTYHVQGLDLTDQCYFVTSVDQAQGRGWLFRISRQDARMHSKRELTDGALIHPGGLQFDGHALWIPNAEYSRNSRAMIYRIDPHTMEVRDSFPVDDHIGAIASNGEDRLYGVNWDALHFYTWDFEGHELVKVESPTSMAYQDIKYVAGVLLCSGHQNGSSVIDVIDPESWTLVKRIGLPRGDRKSTLSREGMAFDGNLHFLPEDGPDSRILVFTLK